MLRQIVIMAKSIRKEPALLKPLLKEQKTSRLQEYYSFWFDNGSVPETKEGVITALESRMTSESVVRKRLGALSKKLIDILKFFLRSETYSSNSQHIVTSKVFSYMNQYEIEAAINALQKRGFVYRSSGSLAAEFEKGTYLIPGELGDTLHGFLWDEEMETWDIFTLEGFLQKTGAADSNGGIRQLLAKGGKKPIDAGSAVRRLSTCAEVRHRIESLEDEGLRKVVAMAITEFGGVMPRCLYEKACSREFPSWNRRWWKAALEDNLLGTISHLSLGEYGINHFDDTLVIFSELVNSWFDKDDGVPASDLEEIRTLGVDLISDISSFLSFIDHNKIRLTLNGSIYKTAVKKIEETFILDKKEEFEDNQVFSFIYSFCLGSRMIQRKDDRRLYLTVKGKSWERYPLEKKLFKILSFAFDEWEPGEEHFHLPRLRKMFIENMKKLDVNRWYDVMYVAYTTRNTYLASLDRENIRDAFQNCYQYNHNTGMRDLQQMANTLFQWMRSRFFLLGLVDMGFRGGKVCSMQLNSLGAKALGVDIPASARIKQNPLIVNPDFEIILIQDGDNYDLITRMDRFAVRTKSDNAYHYKIKSSSVEKAVAEGMTAAEILTILSENSRVDIPQNVIYSIREWSEKVKYVHVREATLLRGRNKEVVDRIVHSGRLKDIIVERLAPTILMIKADMDGKRLDKTLQKLGIFLEKGHDGAGSGDGT